MLTRKLPLATLLTAALLSTGCSAGAQTATDTPKTTDTPKAAPAAAPELPPAAAPAPAAETAKPATETAAKTPSPEEQEKAENRKKIDRLTLEKLRIDTTLDLEAIRRRRDRAAENAERTRIEAETALAKARLAAETAGLDETKSDNERAIALATAKATLEQTRVGAEARVIETQTKLAKAELDLTLAKEAAGAAKVKRELEAQKSIHLRRDYPANPYINGVLHISDRRIDFSGPVTDASANAIITRLHFFNKRDTKAPIFLVIDNSPGGSVLAGYQIVKAMQGSQAPVHVLVKGGAASMAAVITTLAPHSYCFEHSLILHHQMSGGAFGNLTDMSDRIRFMNELYRRTNQPVADKLGVTLDEFRKQMYENNAKGDWMSFGTKAKELKWVDHVITGVVDASVDTLAPDTGPADMSGLMRGMATDVVEATDKDGKPYFQLPPLAPGDAWLISDSANRYRPAR